MNQRLARRSAALGLLVLLGIPGVYWGIKHGVAYVGEPTLYEGDRVENRKCRECGGSGRHSGPPEELPFGGGRCPFCRGRGLVQVVIPGPHRPTRVWGVVLDVEQAAHLDSEEAPHNLRMIDTPFGSASGNARRIPGGIPDARLTLAPEGGAAIEVRADGTGRFTRRLAPGVYQVKVISMGYEALEEEIEVPALTEPIWIEKATVVRFAETEAEARSMYGLNLIVGLVAPEQNGAYLRLVPGSP